MVLNAYAIFDAKADVFGMPFFCLNDPVAQRTIAAAMQDGNTLFGKYPADYQLWRIGSFDDSKGELVPLVPSIVCGLVTLKEVVHAS